MRKLVVTRPDMPLDFWARLLEIELMSHTAMKVDSSFPEGSLRIQCRISGI